MKFCVSIFLIFFTIFSQTSLSDDFGTSLPTLRRSNKNPFIYFLADRTGLAYSRGAVTRFVNVGKLDLKRYSKYLEKKQIFMISEVIRRAELINSTQDQIKKYDLIFQIIELAFFYRYSYNYEDKKLPNKQIYRHPFFHRFIHPYFKDFPFYQDGKNIDRIPSINLVNEKNIFLKKKELNLVTDSSKLSPKDSYFWKKKNIENKEAYDYLDNDIYNKICTNDTLFEFRKHKRTPENGGGLNFGFKAYYKANKYKLKVKIKPTMIRRKDLESVFFFKQEPFFEVTGNKIYSLLGYYTDTGIFCKNIKVKYNPKLLNVSSSSLINPFVWDLTNYYQFAVLKNGQKVKFKNVVNKLVYRDQTKKTHDKPWAQLVMKYTVKSEFKDNIKELHLYGGYIEYRTQKTIRYSGWRKNRISHQMRREIRAMSIIDSWIGSAENFGTNSFKLSLNKKTGQMKFVLTDTGNIFSPARRDVDDDFGNFPAPIRNAFNSGNWERATKLLIPFRKQSELELEVNGFSYSIFTKKYNQITPNWKNLSEAESIKQIETDIQFQSYSRLKDFNHYTMLDDYKFGVRLISSLSKKQIVNSVCLSGLGYAGAMLIAKKLINRRNELVRYFGLENEIPLLENVESITDLSISGPGIIKIDLKNGNHQDVSVKSYGHYVENGLFYTLF